MAGQLQLFSLLVALGVFADCGLAFPSENDVKRYVLKDVHSAVVDDLFDEALPLVRRIIIQNGMDPMELPDFSTQLLALPGKLKGNLTCTQGLMQEVARIKRGKHINVSYADKRLTLDLELGWDKLDFSYTYFFKYLLIQRTGDVYGRFKDLGLRVVLVVDLKRYQIYVDTIEFTEVKIFDLKFEGHKLDPLLNVVTKIVTTLFKEQVLNTVQNESLLIFREVVDDLNKLIPRPNRPVEQNIP